MSSAPAVRSVYRALLRTAAAYPDYNVRAYMLRRTRAGFRGGRALAGEAAAAAVAEASAQLAVAERQRAIAAMFRAEPSVMEAAGSDEARRRGLRTR